MGEYNQSKQGQQSQAIAYNGGGSRQLKRFVDNRSIFPNNRVAQYLKDGTNPVNDTDVGLLDTMSDKRLAAGFWNQSSLSKNFAFDEHDTANFAHSQGNRHSEPKVMAIAGAKGLANNLCLVTERHPCDDCYQDIIDFEKALGQEVDVKYFVDHDDDAAENLYNLYSPHWTVPGSKYG